ncbi:MAG: sialate O-acetylesterase [Ginsengibacter sp.]
MNIIKTQFLLILLFVSTAAIANVHLPKLFSDGMVLQRNQKILLWGWADAGKRIRVIFKKQIKTAITDKTGKWKVYLNPEPAGGPYQLKVTGENTVTINNILIGDVWVCSGQSNMEFPLALSLNAKEEIKNANYPFIRQFNVPKVSSLQPENDFKGGEWKEINPQNVGNLTAVGYFFARDLYNKLKIPIGIISSNVGGTIIETWISRNAFMQSKVFNKMIKAVPTATVEELEKERLDKLIREVDSAQGNLPSANEVTAWKELSYNDADWKTVNVPGLWETKGWPKLDGFVWFRKEIFIDSSGLKESALLNLGSIDESDETYVNGIKVGEMKDDAVSDRLYKIPCGILKNGSNLIAVRIGDKGGVGGFGGPKEKMNLAVGKKIIPLAGDWRYKIESVRSSGVAIYPDDYPTLLFNAMIHPLTQSTIKGVIWYQGESNTPRAWQYRTAFPLMIKDWRKEWGQGNFPFLFVQLPNFGDDNSINKNESAWAVMRESQAMALSLPNTGMAVTYDIGEGENLHPKNKQQVGKRLAEIALNKVYGENVEYTAPVYNSYKIAGNKIIISFTHLGAGFLVKDSQQILKGFTIAGADRNFLVANANVKGNEIVVFNKNLNHPVSVRYAWADDPKDADLFGKNGFPVAPFRTDSWDTITKDVEYQIGF